jgi:ABC-type nitrate/sulfonate/bicarbonate transport system substrate-binding protein
MKNRSQHPVTLGSIALILSISCAAIAPGEAADRKTVSVFMQPSVSTDSVSMADAAGLFKAEELDVQIRLFPSGTTALQTFKTGIGDIIITGDLPALQYWQNGGSYRVIAPVERDTKGYAAAAKIEIKSAKDIVGKVIATRVGSTGSYFVA